MGQEFETLRLPLDEPNVLYRWKNTITKGLKLTGIMIIIFQCIVGALDRSSIVRNMWYPIKILLGYYCFRFIFKSFKKLKNG